MRFLPLLVLTPALLAGCVERDRPEGAPPAEEAPGPPTGEGAVLGGWFCNDAPEPEVLFESDGETRTFRSSIEGGPARLGVWRPLGEGLQIEAEGAVYTFARVAREGDRLILEGPAETWVCALVEDPVE